MIARSRSRGLPVYSRLLFRRNNRKESVPWNGLTTAVCEYWGIHERPDRCVCRSLAPLNSLDIGQPWSRWPGEPNFENGKLVCPVSTFIRSFGLPSFRTALVGLPRSPMDPKRRAGSGGTAVVVTFSTGVQSVSSHWTLVTVIRDFSRRSAASRRVTTCSNFSRIYGKSSLFYVYPRAV